MNELLQRRLNELAEDYDTRDIQISITDTQNRCWSAVAETRREDCTCSVTPLSVYPIFSITKTLVSAFTLAHCESGRLDINSKLKRWFPEIPYAEKTTVLNLLNHTSGLPDYAYLESYNVSVLQHPSEPWDFGKIIEVALTQSHRFEPGMGWGYSNTNYWVLGEILEQELGFPQSFNYWLSNEIGLKNTRYPDLTDFPLASIFGNFQGREQDISQNYHTCWAGPSGAVLSNSADVWQFFNQLFNGQILGPKYLKVMTDGTAVPGDHPDWFKPYYGAGLQIEKDSPLGTLYGHGGNGPGCFSLAQYAPKHQMIGVVISNSEKIDPANILYSMMNCAIGLAR